MVSSWFQWTNIFRVKTTHQIIPDMVNDQGVDFWVEARLKEVVKQFWFHIQLHHDGGERLAMVQAEAIFRLFPYVPWQILAFNACVFSTVPRPLSVCECLESRYAQSFESIYFWIFPASVSQDEFLFRPYLWDQTWSNTSSSWTALVPLEPLGVGPSTTKRWDGAEQGQGRPWNFQQNDSGMTVF